MNLPPSLIDIGANLGHESFDHDRQAIMDAAWAAGIETIIITGTSVSSSQKAAELTAMDPQRLKSTAGVHPHDASEFSGSTGSELKAIAQLPQVLAIGETGLDFNRNFSPETAQEKAFAEQLALAAEVQLPVFLHQRDAHARFLPILKEQRDNLVRGVVHCFTGSKQEMYDYLDLDMYIGITGWICDERRGQDVLALLKEIPADRLLLETDAPYLMPRTIRPRPKGRRNVPEHLVWVLKSVALATDLPEAEIAETTTRNARVFFNL